MNRLIQGQSYLGTREILRRATGDYHDVGSIGQSFARMPKPISNTPFDSIANHRVAHSFADRNP
jgi:hypothetical protein